MLPGVMYPLLEIYNTHQHSQGSEKPCDIGFLNMEFPELILPEPLFCRNAIMFHRTFSETHLGNHSTEPDPYFADDPKVEREVP